MVPMVKVTTPPDWLNVPWLVVAETYAQVGAEGVGEDDAGGGVGAVVRHGDGVGDVVALVGGGGPGVGDGQVGAAGRRSSR